MNISNSDVYNETGLRNLNSSAWPSGFKGRVIITQYGSNQEADQVFNKELAKYKWYAKRCERRFYAERWYKNRNVKMHQEIMGTVEGKVIDHINHNGLDNRKANLRFVTAQQNTWNKRKQKGSYSSRYKGVHWVKCEKNWRAVITCNKKVIYLGRFDDEEAAAKAYDEKAKELFGEYASLNLE